jgi:DNA-directed RNA polymerase subunit RPC12/RpoP
MITDEIFSIHQDSEYIHCPECNGLAYKVFAPPVVKVFKTQVLEHIQDENPPIVRNRQDVTDAINRFNDTQFADQHGKAAVA